MVKDYNANSTNLDSEDDEDPRTPASVSSQVKINTLSSYDTLSDRSDVRNFVTQVFMSFLFNREAKATHPRRVTLWTLKDSHRCKTQHPYQSST